ncbi:MAG: preprotein translocase subunit SecG [Nitrospira sp. SB0662_bin_26]|nr:preprotein translocase subunit SecG [Nitrospira sp. SB0662_bin_26]
MYTATVILHLIVCFLMIAAILLQAGKGAEIGAAFGGSSQTVFGSRGPGTFLSKVTVAAAIIFMLTSLGLALLSKQENVASVIDTPAASGEATSSVPAGTDAAPPEASGVPVDSSETSSSAH